MILGMNIKYVKYTSNNNYAGLDIVNNIVHFHENEIIYCIYDGTNSFISIRKNDIRHDFTFPGPIATKLLIIKNINYDNALLKAFEEEELDYIANELESLNMSDDLSNCFDNMTIKKY